MSDKAGQTGATGKAPAGAAEDAKRLIRSAMKGALATLDRTSGHPYASLVTVATEIDGAPVFLISRLALHTQNLAADPRASVLVEAIGSAADPLALGRVSVIGTARPTTSEAARRRFLARHPEAAGYADFPDFAFYALEVERAHYVGGFGRIVTLNAADVRLDLTGADALAAAEADIVEHMNADHADAVRLYATALLGASDGPWRMIGIDPEGCDILCDGRALRLAFGQRIETPAAVRQELVRLVGAARAGTAKG